MSVAVDILKANRVGVRALKEHLTAKLLHKILIITDRGIPVSVNLPYEDVLELMDILDELSDPEIIATIQEGRKTIREGARGVPVSNFFDRKRKRTK